MTKGQLIGWGIGIVVGLGAAIAGLLWAMMRDGRRRQDEYDKAWKIKKAELERAEGPWPPMPGRGEGA